jgi:hypothetical protein
MGQIAPVGRRAAPTNDSSLGTDAGWRSLMVRDKQDCPFGKENFKYPERTVVPGPRQRRQPALAGTQL